MNLYSQRFCDKFRRSRIVLFVALVLIGAFDYSFLSYAKVTSFTSSFPSVYVGSSGNLQIHNDRGDPPFWTSGGPVLTSTVSSLVLDGSPVSKFKLMYSTVVQGTIPGTSAVTGYINVGSSFTLSNVDTSQRITLIINGVSSGDHSVRITISSNSVLTDNEALNEIVDQNEKFHEEEKTEATNAGNDLGSTLDDVTGTLSTVEILKLPWTMLTDLYNALMSDGETSLTFPSFSLMGQTLWPSYTFSLSTLDTQFSVLFESVRLVSGVMLCVAFGNYLRAFFTKVFGNQEDQEDL